MSSLSSTLLSDIIKLFILSAKQGDLNGIPEASYLSSLLSPYLEEKESGFLITQYEQLLAEVKLRDFSKPYVIPMADSVKMLHTSRTLSKTLTVDQKIILVVLLMEQSRYHKSYSETRMEVARTVSAVLGIDKATVEVLCEFLFLSEAFSANHPSFLYASPESLPVLKSITEIKHLKIPGLTNSLVFYAITKSLLLFRSLETENVSINGHAIIPAKCYAARPGEMLLIDNTVLMADDVTREILTPYRLPPVFIPETTLTPEVIFRPDEGDLFFSGSSVPEDAFDFFNPLLQWLDKFLSSTPPVITVHFRLDFFNTISSKLFLEVLKRIEKKMPATSSASVKWYYEADDDDIMEAGENYAFIVKIPFEMIVVSETSTQPVD